MPESWRLFIALELPGQVKEALAPLQRELAKTGADLRLVKPGSMHLTLKFLGETDAGLVENIATALAPSAAACPALSLRPSGMGCFPGLAQPRVVWVGLDSPSGHLAELRQLAAGLDAALAPLGFEAESRPFSPHLTLARVGSGRGRRELSQVVARHAEFQGPDFRAEGLILIRSELKPGGPAYTSLVKLDFKG